MKSKPINNKKNENLDTTDKLQKILNPNVSNGCIIDMEMYHKLNGIKINIKKFDDEFCEITIKKPKKNTNKKPKPNERNL